MCEILHQRPTFIPTYKPPHRREDLYLEWPWKSFQWIFIPSKSWTHSHWRETTWVSSMCKSIRWRHDLSHHVKSHEWRRAFRCPSHIYMHRECRKRHPMSAINEVDPPARSFFLKPPGKSCENTPWPCYHGGITFSGSFILSSNRELRVDINSVTFVSLKFSFIISFINFKKYKLISSLNKENCVYLDRKIPRPESGSTSSPRLEFCSQRIFPRRTDRYLGTKKLEDHCRLGKSHF